MLFFLIVFHLIITLAMIGIILLQKGEDAGAGMAGAGNAMFSARGAKNLLSRATAVLATLFFLNCLVLAILVRREARLTPLPQAPQEVKVEPEAVKKAPSLPETSSKPLPIEVAPPAADPAPPPKPAAPKSVKPSSKTSSS